MNMPKHIAMKAQKPSGIDAFGGSGDLRVHGVPTRLSSLQSGSRGASEATAPGLVLTSTTTDMPGRSSPRSATSAGTRTRTASRCTILVKLPVALSGGSSENTEPEAGATLCTTPSIFSPGSASTLIDTGWPSLQPRELRLLEVRVDEDVGQRHQRRDALADLHEIAELHGAVADHAVDRRLDLGECQIALGLGQSRLEFGERARRLLLLRLQHTDLRLRAVDRGCRVGHRRHGLVAIGDRLLKRLPAGELLAGQRLLAVVFGLHAHLRGLRRDKLRLGLLDRRLLRHDLLLEPLHRGLLRVDLVAGGIDRQPIVAVIDAGDHVAGAHLGVVVDREVGDIAGHLGAKRRVVGPHIGVVGRHHEAADGDVVETEPPGGGECQCGGAGEQDLRLSRQRWSLLSRRRAGSAAGPRAAPCAPGATSGVTTLRPMTSLLLRCNMTGLHMTEPFGQSFEIRPEPGRCQ